MTAATVEAGRTRAKAAAPRIRLNGDDGGGWILSAPDRPAVIFADFNAAIDGARHAPDARAAAIEVWQSGEYICCLQPTEDPPDGAGDGCVPSLRYHRPLTTVERRANRVAQVLMAGAGVVFWLALMVLALVASLGWKLALL